MKILITGASGLVGSRLSTFLIEQGHNIIPFRLRSNTQAADLVKVFDENVIDAVINLSGESVATRWTDEKKNEIKESRLRSSETLYHALAHANQRPKTLIAASAIGFYGNRGNEIVDEQSDKGTGFLADLAQEWEKVNDQAQTLGIRVVDLRIGIVLSEKGGALAKMLLPFKIGLGGPIGSGEQYMSWIDIDDLAAITHHCLINDSISGPVNAVAPHPVTNKEFTQELGKVLGRPTMLPVPSFGLKAIFGDMADELLINGQKVLPNKLQSSNYKFRYDDLNSSLRHVLNKG